MSSILFSYLNILFCHNIVTHTYSVPTLPYHARVSRIQDKSSSLLYGSPNLVVIKKKCLTFVSLAFRIYFIAKCSHKLFKSTLGAWRSCHSWWLMCIFHYISSPHRVNTELGVAISGSWGGLALRVLTQRRNLNILNPESWHECIWVLQVNVNFTSLNFMSMNFLFRILQNNRFNFKHENQFTNLSRLSHL